MKTKIRLFRRFWAFLLAAILAGSLILPACAEEETIPENVMAEEQNEPEYFTENTEEDAESQEAEAPCPEQTEDTIETNPDEAGPEEALPITGNTEEAETGIEKEETPEKAIDNPEEETEPAETISEESTEEIVEDAEQIEDPAGDAEPAEETIPLEEPAVPAEEEPAAGDSPEIPGPAVDPEKDEADDVVYAVETSETNEADETELPVTTAAFCVREDTVFYDSSELLRAQFRLTKAAVVPVLEETGAAVRILYLFRTEDGAITVCQAWVRKEQLVRMTEQETADWNSAAHGCGQLREGIWLEPVEGILPQTEESKAYAETETKSETLPAEEPETAEPVGSPAATEEYIPEEETPEPEIPVPEELEEPAAVKTEQVSEPELPASEEQEESAAAEIEVPTLEEQTPEAEQVPEENEAVVPFVEEEIAELVSRVMGSISDVLYNAFELGLLPETRNQTPYGDCWAFTGIGAMETDLIADEKADTSIDLSEYYLAYFLSHKYPYPKNGDEGDTILYEGEDSFLNNGGTNYMVFRMLANLIGTVNEEDAPYPDGETEPIPTRYAPIAAQITGAYLIDPNDRLAVKQAILDHGAVTANINMVTGKRTYPGGYAAAFRQNGDKSCLYGTYSAVTHDVLLVGWDDEFAVSNFDETVRPAKPGAWLARNSWGGTGYGAEGYFWISYEDASLLRHKTTAYDAENEDILDFCYSYDKTPYPASRYLVADEAVVRQTFHADGHEILQAVGVETASEHLHLHISLRCEGEEIASGEMFAEYEGFYRVMLNAPYVLGQAADIEITVTYTARDEGGDVRVPFAPVGTSIQGQIHYTNKSGEGGFWFNNEWYAGDSRLKLYTKKTPLEDEVESLTLSAETLQMQSGERVILTAEMTPEQPANPEIKWTSSDPRIADVSSNGLVTAGRREGTAVITAMTNRGKYATCTVENTYRDHAVLKSANVEFDGLIHLLFTYDLTGIREENRDRLYIAFRRDGILMKKCSLNDWLDTETEEKADGMHTYARYTCPVPIANYLDLLNIRVEDAEGTEISTATGKGIIVINGYDYALSTYAVNMIDHGSARMKRMAQALKDYGIAALQYIGSSTGGQTVSPEVIHFDVDSIDINETRTSGQKPEGVTASQNVEFGSDNSLMVIFRLPEDKETGDFLFMQDGKEVFPAAEEDPETGKRQVTLTIASIAPDHLNTLHSFSISDGDNTFAVSTSVLGYAKRKSERGSANMKILAKALCNYYVEALRYQESCME